MEFLLDNFPLQQCPGVSRLDIGAAGQFGSWGTYNCKTDGF